MKYILKFSIPNDIGNEKIRDPQFGAKVKDLLGEIKAEAAYFGTVDGCRGGYVIVNINDASQIPGIGEPFFLWLNADVEFSPVMTPEDLGKADGAIQAAISKWG